MKTLLAGLDVGSTTVKIVVLHPDTREMLHGDYRRHDANQAGVVRELLEEAHGLFPDNDFRLSFCGSAGEPFAGLTGAFFIQEVVANAVAIKELHPEVRVAIELGGQDAKVVFFRIDDITGQLIASDMRMNGSCAGGTGAFVDQIAELLSIKTEDFNELAARGNTVYDISGRCGVFAKTDIQPLLNQGVAKSDIALSCFHALAKQTIGGLAQGMEISPPVIFEGGPLTFNPVLIRVFAERLNLGEHQIVHTSRPELIVATGAALSNQIMFADRPNGYGGRRALSALAKARSRSGFEIRNDSPRLFDNASEVDAFTKRYPGDLWKPRPLVSGSRVEAWLGIDGGSTTTKFVLMADDQSVIDKFYANNQGDPLAVLKKSLIELRDRYRESGVDLVIKACGTTGYGEQLFAAALKADFHCVETVAHAKAAQSIDPDASFILDIGGQDMKAIFVNKGIVTGIVLNEACSAGCGSFLETYAKSLKIPVQDIASLAFAAENPSRLGSRCTVFMNSSIITEQKAGKTTAEIMSGLCRSVIENVFTKVVRVSNLETLGDHVVVQGGTFKNDAVLRAFEQYLGKTVNRPPLPGEMGAIGAAILTKENFERRIAANPELKSRFIGLDDLESFTWTNESGVICRFCANNCNRTVVSFCDGSSYITGNRCEKGEIIGDIHDPGTREKLQAAIRRQGSIPDTMKLYRELLFKDWPIAEVKHRHPLIIGLPRVLEFWASMPFWTTLFRSLGMTVKISRKSSYEIFERGLPNVPSDTACFPAKLSHGHILDLIDQGVDRIFFPMMAITPVEQRLTEDSYTCPLVQGYPAVIDKADEPATRYGVPYDHPIFFWYDESHKEKQVVRYLTETLGIIPSRARRAFAAGQRAMSGLRSAMHREGRRILNETAAEGRFAVVLSGRPYHCDELINHNLSNLFTSLGFPVLTLEALEGLSDHDISRSRMDAYNAFHTRMIAAAFEVGKNPHLELVQIVNFGCGHDAIISDEMVRILREKSGKEMLVLKLDEGENIGPLTIRVKSFVETIKSRRQALVERESRESGQGDGRSWKPLSDPYPVRFTRSDRKKTILVPNLSESFSRIIGAAIEVDGYRVMNMPLADASAIELGKKHVHNDICFPAQVNVGEILATLKSGAVDPDSAVAGIAKNCKDCRAGHYMMLARKALDEAGFPQVPIITTGEDKKHAHPGFRLSLGFQVRMVWGLAMVDALESMVRMIRPYERVSGETDRAWKEAIDHISAALEKPARQCVALMRRIVDRFNRIPCDRSERKPRVGILGEILLNFHPSSNSNIEAYLESHGMEVVQPSMTDFFRRDSYAAIKKYKRDLLDDRFIQPLIAGITDKVFTHIGRRIDEVMQSFRYYRGHFDLDDLTRNIKGLIDDVYLPGEGWLMAGEIIEMARDGVDNFLILNPFGCLPNHITGRGFIKPLKKRLPHIQILSLDFDPDTAFANIENRLQMLIITARELHKRREAAAQKTAERAML